MSRSRILQENTDFVLLEDSAQLRAEDDVYSEIGTADGVGVAISSIRLFALSSGIANGDSSASNTELTFIAPTSGTADGLGTVSGLFSGTVQIIALADGLGFLYGDANALKFASGNADGVGIAYAVPYALTTNSGIANGIGDAYGVAATVISNSATADGLGSAEASQLLIMPTGGTVEGLGTASGSQLLVVQIPPLLAQGVGTLSTDTLQYAVASATANGTSTAYLFANADYYESGIASGIASASGIGRRVQDGSNYLFPCDPDAVTPTPVLTPCDPVEPSPVLSQPSRRW